ncbi:InlB B-repeat-containing protein [uncultured Fibrobacter sp.]|uniref:InlB B-repeat-containing protein n=1 Tax=uncultured Fibrobacter sp. TaxID=261512 RepID=UPI0026302A4C|nr:InlB B-repeat-containing protein [uncultured Fibrobacter sp.]
MTCLVLVGQVFAVDSEAWDGMSMTEPSTESIDGKVYYKIYTAAELAWFAAQTNTVDNNQYLSKNAKLMADLDMGDKLWTPIAVGTGNDNRRIYSGIFDGNGHSISNLYISAKELMAIHHDSTFYAQNLGFIGCFKGTLKNLNIIDIEVHGFGKGGLNDKNKIVEKPISIGTVVGWQSGNSSIDGCSASGVVVTSGDGQAVGGIVGNIGGGNISNCVSTVSIRASGLAYVGGIAGYTKNYTGAVTVSSCVYAGTELSAEGSAVVGGKTYNSAAGAIVGHQYQGNVTLSNLYYDSDLFGADGGIGATTKGGSYTTTGSATGVPDVNSEDVVCPLNNGTMVDGECSKDSPWSVGESSVSLYGSDGFTVTFNAKSGVFPDGAKKKKIILKDKIITPEEISAPVHADSAFAGWSLSPIATEPDADLGSVSGSATVYAVWYPIFTITFSAAPGKYADGTTVEKTVKVARGDMISVTGMEVPATYKRNDSTLYFTGWSDTRKEFKAEDDITDSDTLHLDGIVATGNMTFYAAWTKARTFTVTYNANGHGKTKVDFVNVEKGETLTEPPAPTPDEGYEYSGWCLDILACNTNTYFAFDTTAIDTNYVLYADWNAIAYTITYNLEGGTNNVGNPATYTIEDASIVFEAPVKEGYDFKGWFYDDHFNEIAKQITSGSTGNKVLYAKWEEKTYTIAYMAGSGAVGSISPAQKGYGMSITLAEGGHYTRDGFTQDGWAIEDGGESVYALGGSYSNNADITLYPHWVEGNVEISSYGALTIYTYAANDVRAVINGDYTGSEAVEITQDITVNSVTLDRTFNANKISTLYVPFEIAATDVVGADVYKFKTVVWNEDENRWKFKVTTTETVKPNTPYVVLPKGAEVSFNITGTVTLNTETEGEVASNGQWDFVGTYSYISFVQSNTDPIYLFANQERDGAKLGQFVRIGTGAYTNPMRAYLVYHKSAPVAAKSIHGNLGGSILLPDELDIEIENEKGVVVQTGKLNTVTGEVRMDRWFDLKGRRLNSKPSAKGTYYKNGKKVIIK